MPRTNFSSKIHWLGVALAGVALVVLSGCSSDKPTQPPTATPPDITAFTGLPVDIVPGDSVLLSYTAVRSDSLKLYPSGLLLANASAGSLYVRPSAVTVYTLRAYSRGGQDSAKVTITMNAAAPQINSMTLGEDTLVINDSTQLTWTAVRTDSIRLNGGAKLNPATGSTIWVVPPANGQLVLIAYNAYGADTASAQVRIEVPYAIQHITNRRYFKGSFGSSDIDPLMRLKVVDNAAATLYKVWMKFSLVEGDGDLSADSLQAAAAGNALLTYDFSGVQGHALIRAMVPGVDTLDLTVRASTIAPGVDFQGQFLRNGDGYAAVKALNGLPVADTPDPRPSVNINYVDYESQLGVVGIVGDVIDNNTSDDNEPLLGVILNTIYSGTASSGWGINSPVQDLLSEYGAVIPSYDPNPPAAYQYDWPGIGLTAYTSTEASESQRRVFEVHLVEAQPALAAKLPRLQRQR